MEDVYLIDAAARTIQARQLESFGSAREWLPGGLCIGQAYPNGDVLYVDDEALLRPATVAFRIRSRADGQPMMSHGILTGRDHGDATLPPGFTLDELKSDIEWLDLAEALNWFRAKAAAPAVTSQRGGEQRQVFAHWTDLLTNLEGGMGYDPRTDEALQAELLRR